MEISCLFLATNNNHLKARKLLKPSPADEGRQEIGGKPFALIATRNEII